MDQESKQEALAYLQGILDDLKDAKFDEANREIAERVMEKMLALRELIEGV